MVSRVGLSAAKFETGCLKPGECSAPTIGTTNTVTVKTYLDSNASFDGPLDNFFFSYGRV